MKINLSSSLGSPVIVADLNSVLNSQPLRALTRFSRALPFRQGTLCTKFPSPDDAAAICARLLDFTFTILVLGASVPSVLPYFEHEFGNRAVVGTSGVGILLSCWMSVEMGSMRAAVP